MNETVEYWLAFAREDLQSAKLLLEKGIYNQACFHSQQCVEKALKALFIYHQGRMPPRIHMIVDLLGLLPTKWFADVAADSIEKIDNYYIITRYPDALPGTLEQGLPEKDEAEEAVALAHIMIEKAKHLIQDLGKEKA